MSKANLALASAPAMSASLPPSSAHFIWALQQNKGMSKRANNLHHAQPATPPCQFRQPPLPSRHALYGVRAGAEHMINKTLHTPTLHIHTKSSWLRSPAQRAGLQPVSHPSHIVSTPCATCPRSAAGPGTKPCCARGGVTHAHAHNPLATAP